MSKVPSNKSELRGFMGWVERTGNKLPDPVVLFCILCALLIVVSVLSSFLSLSAFHPVQKNADGSNLLVKAVSLLSVENIRKFWVEMPTTFTHFHPLGYVLVVMLGAGVAEKSGLFGSALRLAVNAAPKKLLTPSSGMPMPQRGFSATRKGRYSPMSQPNLTRMMTGLIGILASSSLWATAELDSSLLLKTRPPRDMRHPYIATTSRPEHKVKTAA